MARKKSLETQTRWKNLVDSQARSGLSVRAFCEQHGIGENSFYRWRSELRRRKRTKKVTAGQETVLAAASNFVPVHLSEIATAAIELIHPLGYQIRLDGAVDPQMLQHVLDVLDRRGDA